MKWQNIKISDSAIKRSMQKSLHERLGADATLGDVARMTIGDLESIPGGGRIALKSVMESIRRGVMGEPQMDEETVLDVVQRAISTRYEGAPPQGDATERGY
jgi:hypothetical protein